MNKNVKKVLSKGADKSSNFQGHVISVSKYRQGYKVIIIEQQLHDKKITQTYCKTYDEVREFILVSL